MDLPTQISRTTGAKARARKFAANTCDGAPGLRRGSAYPHACTHLRSRHQAPRPDQARRVPSIPPHDRGATRSTEEFSASFQLALDFMVSIVASSWSNGTVR